MTNINDFKTLGFIDDQGRADESPKILSKDGDEVFLNSFVPIEKIHLKNQANRRILTSKKQNITSLKMSFAPLFKRLRRNFQRFFKWCEMMV